MGGGDLGYGEEGGVSGEGEGSVDAERDFSQGRTGR